jgi:hypothetical protein
MRLTLLNQFYTPDVAPTGQLAASLARHRAALGDQVTVITGRGGYVPGCLRHARTPGSFGCGPPAWERAAGFAGW